MKPQPDVTDAELAVLKELWSAGPLTIRQLTERLYPEGDAAHYATVQKLLERLAGKRCVERTAAGRAHLYRAAVARDDLVAARLRETADRLCEGSLTPLLTHLVGTSRLESDAIAALRDLVDRLDREEDEER